jgi:putative membrane protein insertion efficiency factor
MNFLKNYINNIMYLIFKYIIIIYQKIISPIIPARCRYYPTCSHYGRQALAWHGVWAGSWLLLKRLGRCQPWGGHGVDFVPLPLASYVYDYLPTIVPRSAVKVTNTVTSKHVYVYRDNSSYVARLNHLMK